MQPFIQSKVRVLFIAQYLLHPTCSGMLLAGNERRGNVVKLPLRHKERKHFWAFGPIIFDERPRGRSSRLAQKPNDSPTTPKMTTLRTILQQTGLCSPLRPSREERQPQQECCSALRLQMQDGL